MEIVLFEDVCRIEVLNDGELFFWPIQACGLFERTHFIYIKIVWAKVGLAH